MRPRLLAFAVFLVPSAVGAAVGDHPYLPPKKGVWTVDLSADARATHAYVSAPVERRDFRQTLADVEAGRVPADPDGKSPRTGLPAGLVQRGSQVVPRAIDDGSLVVEPETIFAVTDIPGNEYPRKHTLYLNFTGGELKTGADNSAENKSTLAGSGIYPVFSQGETKAVSVAQAVANDYAAFGVTVVYEDRPEKVLPYTMQMIGGDWTDTNLDSPAGGVAPGADCGALGQRHVVYTFETGSASQMANTASQESGHAYGLDHSLNCGSVMSYCGGGDGQFYDQCDDLCESQCQGPGSIGCNQMHQMFCAEGEQNEGAELAMIFGGNEPDMEPPTAEIQSPADGAELGAGADVQFRAVVSDNYGGYGWKFVFKKDGEVIFDQVDYDREVDDTYRAAVNLTKLDPGVYELAIEVHDHFGGIGTDSVTVFVGGATDSGGSGGSDGDGTGDASGTDDAAGSDDADDASGGAVDGTGGGGQTGGADDGGSKSDCACRSDADATPAGLGVMLLALGLRRRRR